MVLLGIGDGGGEGRRRRAKRLMWRKRRWWREPVERELMVSGK